MSQPSPRTQQARESPAARAPRYGLEVLAVLGVSLGMSAITALLYYVRQQVTVAGGISHTTACVLCAPASQHVWLDALDRLADVLKGALPAFLSIVLLMRDPAGRGLGIGLDLTQRRRDLLTGVGFTALIGIPGLLLVWAAYQLNLNARLAVVDLPDAWYRIPVLLLSAAQNGIVEEIIVVGYLLTRLRQMGWTNSRALGASALLRGTYHLYQGYGGFFGNMAMGLIFGWWFQRTRRVLPLVIAHALIDAISFIGYVYLHDKVSWI